MRLAASGLLAAAVLSAGPLRAAEIDEAQVRAFVASQQKAWNAGALDAYFASFRPDAKFTDQYRTPAGKVVPYGTSSLSQAKAQTRKFRAASRSTESGEVERITIGVDGRTAEVTSRVTSRIQNAKGLRVTCAERRQDLMLTAGGKLGSHGQTDTFARCPR